MAVPILPQFDVAAPLPLGAPGRWAVYGAPDFLDKLVKSLAQGTALKDAQSIDSVPHVWAKPLLFKMALFDNDFVVGLKEHVKGEWRALLAMLALKDVLHLNLTASRIDLTADGSSEAKVFKDLAPTESLNGNGDAWVTNTYIISFDGAPIAMTSPVTLVATAADYSDNLLVPLTAPWSNNGLFLTDPIPHLSNHALNALKFWLDDLKNNLVAMAGVAGAKTDLIATLLTCVTDYIADVNAEINATGGIFAPAGTFEFAPSALNLVPLLNGLLQNTVQSIVVAPSAVELILGKQNLLLVSPQMLQELAAQLGIPLAHIVVYGGLTANQITDASLQQGHNQIDAVILVGIEWRRPEEFFQEQMVLLPGANFFCNSLNSVKTTILNKFTAILPIKPELVEIFSASEINARIKFTYADRNGDSTVTLTFKFPLSGIDGHAVTYKFEKVYSQADNTLIKVTATEIPVVEIWPDFIWDEWKNYYLHYSNSRSESADGAKSPAKNLCFFAPWSSKADFTADMPTNELADIFTANMNSFPNALTCTYVSANGNPIKAGMIFLKKPTTVDPKAALTWNVGIDFGTSATMIFFDKGDGNSQPLNLKPHLYQITNSDVSKRATSTTLNFISDNDKFIRDGSFLSVFHLLNHHIAGMDPIRPLQDGHVLLLNSKSPYHKQAQFAAFIDTNIKWDNTKKLEAYVQQICMQIFVEALSANVGNVSWNFSYPLAFTHLQWTNFIGTCRNAVNMLNQGASVNDLPESEALAYYFCKLKGSMLNHSICIDIGAGTTDISVISDAPSRIVFHTSVQYAGRHIFNSIYENFGLFTGTGERFTNPLTNKAAQAAIDLDMRDNSEEYIKNLKHVLADNATSVQAARALQLAHLAVAGLFYYLGKILKALRAANFYTVDKLPQVFVGGNGSRIFNWLTQGMGLNDESSYTAVLKEMLSDASGWETDKLGGFSLKLSETFKIEVASGMISPRPMGFYNKNKIIKEFSAKFDDRYTRNAVIAGARFSGDSAHTAEDLLNETDIQKGIKIDGTLEEFKKFISVFNKYVKLYDLDSNGIVENEKFAAVIEEVCSATCGFYDNQIGQDLGKISVEPIFIVELKEFIKNAKGLF